MARFQSTPSTGPLHPGAIADCVLPAPGPADAEALTARADAVRRDPGVGLEAGVRGDFADEPTDEGIPGAYVGLAFELLDGGLFENRRTAELLGVRARDAALRSQREEARRAAACSARGVEAAFQPLLRELLLEKRRSVERIVPLQRRTYLSGLAHLDLVLDSERELVRTSTALGPDADAVGDEPSPIVFPAAFDLDRAALEARLGEDDLEERLLELRTTELQLARALDSRTRLRFYMRYGVRPRDSARDVRGFSGGLIFRMPLFQRSDAGLASEIVAAERRAGREKADRAASVDAAFDRFREQLERVVTQHYLYLESYERVRRSAAGRRVAPSDADLGVALERVVDLHGASVERAEVLRLLHTSAADVFAAAGIPWDEDVVRPLDLPDTRYRGRSGPRELYVWSDSFNRYDNAFLLDLTRAKAFSRVLVSAGASTRADKLADFRERADAVGVAVDLVLSTNAWLDPERRHGVTERISGLDLDGVGLHLDVEPHTLEAFREAPDSLLRAYIDVVRRAREAAGRARLSVAVPVWWPDAVYAEISEMADRVYLMAYEEPDPGRLVERVSRVVDRLSAERATLVLRAEDFPTEWALDVTFAHVADALAIREGAVHDLDAFLDLTEGGR